MPGWVGDSNARIGRPSINWGRCARCGAISVRKNWWAGMRAAYLSALDVAVGGGFSTVALPLGWRARRLPG